MHKNKTRAALALAAAVMLAPLPAGAAPTHAAGAAHARQLERGRYLVMIGGCNDCHTANYGPRDGKVPQSEWLLGSGPFGFRGPWGTTYPPNLRLTLAKLTENQWVKFAKGLKTRPPMPWFTLTAMHESDLRLIYRFIKSLGPVGEPVPAYLPPSQEPKPPYAQWPMGK